MTHGPIGNKKQHPTPGCCFTTLFPHAPRSTLSFVAARIARQSSPLVIASETKQSSNHPYHLDCVGHLHAITKTKEKNPTILRQNLSNKKSTLYIHLFACAIYGKFSTLQLYIYNESGKECSDFCVFLRFYWFHYLH